MVTTPAQDTHLADTKAAWLRHYAAVWGMHTWPAGTTLGICSQAGHVNPSKRGPFQFVAHVPIDDPDAAWKFIARETEQGRSTYIGVGPMAGVKTGRGKRADVVGLPALFADIDISSGIHALGEALPTEAEALAWIEAMPLKPTLVTRTGGGFHVWLVLSEPLDPAADEGQRVLAGWKGWWVARAAASGRAIDEGVLADAARVLRPVGGVNPNQEGAPQVVIEREHNDVYDSAVVEVCFPVIDRPTLPAGATRGAEAADPANRTPPITPETAVRPGDKFSYAVPADEFLIATVRARRTGDGGLVTPRPDGSYASDASIRLYPATADSPAKVTAFGQRVQGEWGITQNHSWSSFDLLTHLWMGNDWKQSATAVNRLEGRFDDLLAALAEVEPGSDIPQLIQDVLRPRASIAPATVLVPQTGTDVEHAYPVEPMQPARSEEVDLLASSLFRSQHELLAQAVEHDLGGDDFAIVGGRASEHGLWRREHYKDMDDGGQMKVRRVRVTNGWVARITRVVEDRIIGPDGIPVDAEQSKFDVELIRADGRRFQRTGLTASEATSVESLLASLNAGVKVPIEQKDVKRARNMILTLGHEVQDNVVQYGSTGWACIDGRVVMLAPAGSMTADGPTEAFTVGPPPGSDKKALNAGPSATGWTRVAEGAELRDVAHAVPSYVGAFTTAKKQVPFALLGAMFAAPLALARGTVIWLIGTHSSGKSWAASAAYAFVSAVPVEGKSFTGTFIKTTEFGAATILGWSRNVAAVIDDYNLSEDRLANHTMQAAANVILRQAYGADPGTSGGGAGGGLRAKTTAQTVAIIPAEVRPPAGSAGQRALIVPMEGGDLMLEPRGAAPFDAFLNEYAHTAKMHLLGGAYYRWLAERIERVGIAEFSQQNSAMKKELYREASGRGGEHAAVVGVGWRMFLEFATENGFADLLPTIDEIDAEMLQLAANTTAVSREESYGQRMVTAVADAIAGNTGYLTTVGSTAPAENVAEYGWTTVRGEESPVGREALGKLSNDGRLVLITNDGLRKARNLAGISSRGADAVARAMADLVEPGSKPGAEAGRDFGFGRTKGFVIAAHKLGLPASYSDECIRKLAARGLSMPKYVPDMPTEDAADGPQPVAPPTVGELVEKDEPF